LYIFDLILGLIACKRLRFGAVFFSGGFYEFVTVKSRPASIDSTQLVRYRPTLEFALSKHFATESE